MSPIQRPTRADARLFNTAEDFRAWLREHHATTNETWVGYYRKGAGKVAMTYVEAVLEALAYGWIDGITYRVDEEVTATRFTPRRRASSWSAVNIGRVEQLLADGRMTPAGLAAFARRDSSAETRYSYETRPADLPDAMLAVLRANEAARAYWEGQTPAYRRTAAFWVTSAKREATRQRRLEQLIADAFAGRPIRLLAYGRSASGTR